VASRRKRRPSRSRLALRWVGLAVLLAVAVAYIQPLRAYRESRDEVAKRRAEIAVLERETAALAERVRLTDDESFVEREARRLGLVRPGERLFIVKGIEDWPRSRAGQPNGTPIR
jgi:cell division protein FtsB